MTIYSQQYSVVPDGYGASAEEAQRVYDLSQTGILQSLTKGAVAVDQTLDQSGSSLLKSKTIEYKGSVWRPKFRDAVDIIIDRILNSTTIEPLKGFSDEELAHFGKLRDLSEKIDPEYAGFGVKPTGKRSKSGSHRSKVMKHAAEHKREAFVDFGDELK